MEKLTKQEAEDFFGKIFGGNHHIPGEVKQFGDGWAVNYSGDLATFDYNHLTKIVLLAHDECVRASIQPAGARNVKIAIWKRKREGSTFERHPSLDDAVTQLRDYYFKLKADA